MSRVLVAAGIVAALGIATASAWGQEQAPNRREFTITASNHRYNPDTLEVAQYDLVKITFRSEDEPHSFVIDAYRIVKRAAGGQSVIFEFRADQVGSFPYYCNLTSDAGCREMKGTLVVKSR
jgi:heme/copper-type cytochrome/quinol oxidase subunit 2